jgi:HK97 family phage major capsid protein
MTIGSTRDFIKVARSIALAKIHQCSPTDVARRLYDNDRDRHVVEILKADVDSHGTTGTGSELYSPQRTSAEFVQAVRPLTILGRLQYRRVPFNTPLPFISVGTTFDFVGERMPISATVPSFGTNLIFAHTKIAGIIVASNTLLEHSQAEDVLRRDMVAGVIEASDRRLLDPDSDDDSGARPASITNGITAVDASGATDSTDVDAIVAELINQLVTAGSTLRLAKFVTTNQVAIAISMLRDNGVKAFPNVKATGGELGGLELLTSASAPANQLTLVDGDEVLVADDNEAEIENSRVALIDQNTAPEGNTRVSMFQTESTAMRVTRYINWSMRKPFVALATGLDLALPELSTTA